MPLVNDMPVLKRWKRRLRKLRNRWARRAFATRYGRELLIQCISPRVLSMTADCGDHVMTFSPHDYIGRKVYRKGQFERDHVVRLLTVLRERRISLSGALLEVGGNIGTQTIYFALGSDIPRIVTVEADPRNYALLTQNIRQNRLEDRITAVACAAGETMGTIDFFQHPDNHGKSSTTRQSPRDRQISVPVRPVMDILAGENIAADGVSLIFMDIEGYEPVAARSMIPLLERRTPFYLEFSPVFYGHAEARAFAEWLGTFYSRCMVFTEDAMTEMALADIPLDQDQFDLLLLPDSA
ncbi:FkbM family methyltransferase [Rhizobium sp. PP-F2F-G48]|uniref:FkbM family methyltransferase n=1 Tax=Rhizobium sp. PP-F2F-G48 TaxID=2135651 RepID=UPI0010D6FA16|nr:FkbM family methyltransferase [Rhizobium sp. PP-F2F-G48]TCM58272.1 FkbM family methyltransferase [Rhizobium sp. PP-F2F-G48]